MQRDINYRSEFGVFLWILLERSLPMMRRDSSLTGNELDGWSSITSKNNVSFYATTSNSPRGPTDGSISVLFNWNWRFFRWCRKTREDHSPPSSAEVNKIANV
jgi:hypothetical protein